MYPVNADEWKSNIKTTVLDAESLPCESYPKIDDLELVFACENAFLEVSNAIYSGWLRTNNKVERLKYLAILWTKGSEFSHLFTIPSIRLTIAQLLGQGKRNALYSESIQGMLEYVIQYIDSDNAFIQIDAVAALGWVGEHKDAEVLKEVILTEKEGISDKAVLALVNLSHPMVTEDIKMLMNEVERNELKNMLTEKYNALVYR